MAEMVAAAMEEEIVTKANTTSALAGIPPKKPDKQEVDKQAEEIQAEIEKLQEKIQGFKLQIDKILNDRSGSKGDVDAAKGAVQKLYNEKKQLSVEKAQIMASRDAARASLNARIAQEKQLRGEIKFSSLDAIDSQIKDLERRQATMSMSLSDEKKIIKDIKALQLSKKSVQSLSEIKAAIEREKEATKVLEKAHDEKFKVFKEVNDRITAQREILDNLTKGNSENREVIPALRQEEKGCLDAINEKYQSIRNLRSDFKKREDAYYVYLREEKARKQEARQKEVEARKLEEEEKRKAMEAEELAKVPYEEEMQLCDYLTSYLKKFATESAKDEDSENIASSGDSSLSLDDGGMRVLRRDLDDFTGIATVKKRGKKKGGANLKKKDILAHGVDTIDFFALLDIVPPATISAVSSSIEAIAKKKAFFQTLERGAVVSIADKNKLAAKQDKTVSTKDKKKSAFSLEQDFPTLAPKVSGKQELVNAADEVIAADGQATSTPDSTGE